MIKVEAIGTDGILISTTNRNKLFLSYYRYPFFKNKKPKYIKNVTEPTLDHYYWPDLDMDLSFNIIWYRRYNNDRFRHRP